MKKVKKRSLSIGFFRILHGEYLLKQKVVVVETPVWKFKANIARNIMFEGRLGPNVCLIWVKNGKKTYYFQEFDFSYIVSLKVTKLIIQFLSLLTK